MSQMFKLLKDANTPTVIGKAWWNEALKLSQTGDARRGVLVAAGVMGALFVVPPVCGFVLGGDDDDDDTRRERRRALQAQQEFGWSFGATDEVASVGVGMGPPAGSEAMDNLSAILMPKNPRWAPAWVPTLFESLAAKPTSATVPEDVRASSFRPLRDVVRPSLPSSSMTAQNEGFFLLNAITEVKNAAIVVDLNGPDAVAYALALADVYDPVFLFDNWPHPRGVVKAHETLAAALALAPEFARKKLNRPVEAPPCFVLDRSRLAPYTDDASQFDNRSLARLPPVEMLVSAGIQNVFYVAPSTASPIDMDDVVDDLVAWKAKGIAVRAVLVDAIGEPVTPGRIGAFCKAHGFALPPGATAVDVPVPGATYTPTARSSQYAGHHPPAGFGEVPVVVSVGTGVLLGAVLYRNGSWNRAPVSTSYFGGG